MFNIFSINIENASHSYLWQLKNENTVTIPVNKYGICSRFFNCKKEYPLSLDKNVIFILLKFSKRWLKINFSSSFFSNKWYINNLMKRVKKCTLIRLSCLKNRGLILSYFIIFRNICFLNTMRGSIWFIYFSVFIKCLYNLFLLNQSGN